VPAIPAPGGGVSVDNLLDAAFGGPAPAATRILSLSNMVTNDDLADDEEYK
jgi:hypothetical protein